MTRIFYLLVLLIIQTSTTMAQSTSFKKYLGASVDWWPKSITADANGRIYSIIREDAGNTDKTVIACTDSLGNMVWMKKWGANDQILQPELIRTLSGGQLMVIGTYYNPMGGGSDGIFLAMQPDGSPLAQFLLRSINYETVRDFAIAPNGNFYVLGEIGTSNGYGSFITEITPVGQVVKTRVLSKGTYTYYQSIEVYEEGFYISGFDIPGNGNPSTALLSRFDHDFNLLWTAEASATGKQVKGYDILPILANGNVRQFVRNEDKTYLIERDSGGQFVNEHLVGIGEIAGSVEAGNHYASVSRAGELLVIDRASGALAARMDWDGSSSNPVLLPGNTVVSLGYENVNGIIQTTISKGVFNFGPGCAGYYYDLSGPANSGLGTAFVQPVVSVNTSLAVQPANVLVDVNSNYTFNPGCSKQCNYAPVAAFTFSAVDFTVSFSADTIDNDATYDWSLSDGSTLFGAGGSFTVSNPGTYQLCLDVEGPCGKTRLCKDIQIAVGGVFDKAETIQIEVVPNPTYGQFRLSGLEPGMYTYTVTDLLGRQVAAGTQYLDHNTVFEASDWQSGQQYFFIARKDGEVYAARIIKQ